jgi:hypothetical protein
MTWSPERRLAQVSRVQTVTAPLAASSSSRQSLGVAAVKLVDRDCDLGQDKMGSSELWR